MYLCIHIHNTHTHCALCIGDTCSFTVLVDQCTGLLDSAPTAKTLLTCLLKMDPAYRMSASQILETPWITVRQPFLSGRAHPTFPQRVTPAALNGVLCPTG